MATAKTKIRSSFDGVDLSLNAEEAIALRDLLGRFIIGGGRRQLFDDIFDALGTDVPSGDLICEVPEGDWHVLEVKN